MMSKGANGTLLFPGRDINENGGFNGEKPQAKIRNKLTDSQNASIL